MLAELNIRNFALIERQRVALGAGLCVVSGGTGAGKSLAVDALKFVLGARGTTDVIRAGAEEAAVEALFYVDAPAERARVVAAAPALLEEFEGELIITRSINRAGRSRATVNGRLAPVGALQELGERLVEVCGQHDAQALFRATEQRAIVDAFGGTEPLREQFSRAYEAHRVASEKLAAIESGARDRGLRREALEFQVRELKTVGAKRGELEELEQELGRLENAAKIRAALRSGYNGLYESDSAVLAKLAALGREIEPLKPLVPELARVGQFIADASALLEEAALSCRDLRSGFRLDEDRREEVDERIGAIRRASTKYAREPDRLPELLAELEGELATIEGAGGSATALRDEVKKRAAEVASLGAKLTTARRAAAKKLGEEVASELDDLGMKGASLAIEISTDPTGAGPDGLDRVEMLVRTNPGAEPMPLRKIASGGEASRVMLAVKARLAGRGSVPTLVFDEIDANVGGRLGSTIGQKLRTLAARYQVLCVTHLPQIASFADRHLSVAKATENGRTVTTIREVSGDERLQEIAQMIRGDAVTEQTLAEAADMVATSAGSGAVTGTKKVRS